MTGNDLGFFRQGEEPFPQGFQYLLGASARQVGPSDRAGEQRIPGKEQLFRGKVQADTAGRMPRGVKYLCFQVQQSDPYEVVRTSVQLYDFRSFHTKPRGLHIHLLEKRQIMLVHQDDGTGDLLQLCRRANMIDMRMSDHYLFQGKSVMRQPRQDVSNVIAGIDDHGGSSCLFTQDRAVTSQRTDRKSLENHILIVWASG